MNKHVIETVTFRINADVSREAFKQAAEAINRFVTARPGFVARRLSCAEDGLWIEHIEWADKQSALDAAAALGQDQVSHAFLSAIDGPTVRMHHAELQVSIN